MRRDRFDAARLWSGGAATAVVAGLIALVGILLARGVLHVPILAPQGDGVWGDADTTSYVVAAAVATLLATALLQLLVLTTPRAVEFFTWIMVLLTALTVIMPLGLATGMVVKVTTAVLNLVIGLATMGILRGIAESARRPPPNIAGHRLPDPRHHPW